MPDSIGGSDGEIFIMDGIINVLKPSGMTSFDVIARLRRIYGQKKIGHGGTLDPLAAGVLPVFLGKATRLIEYAPIHTKTYEAEFVMGIETDTEDMTGHIIEKGPIERDSMRWEAAIQNYVGVIEQVPSRYSAISVQGKRAYQWARAGEDVVIPPRQVTIHRIQIREIEIPYVRLSVSCSSGTYIRSLGRDIGRHVGTPLTLSFLLRTQMGAFSIEEARTLEEIEKNPEGALINDVRPLLSELPELSLDARKGRDFLQGKRIPVKDRDKEKVAVFEEGRFLGIGAIQNHILHPKKVFS